MKHTILILFGVLLVLSQTACRHQECANPWADTAHINLEGVVRQPCNGFEFIAIQDREQPFSSQLFRGVDDSLLAQTFPGGEAQGSVNVFLLASDQTNILFDAGVGAANGGLLQQKLKALQLAPEDIHAVILTHLHPDHIGGLLYEEGPAFPNAQLFLSTAEFEAWTNGPLSQHNEQVIQVLANYADRVNLFSDGDTLDEPHGYPLRPFRDAATGDSYSVVAHLAPGHTPGHTVYTIGDILIAGDLIHVQSLQIAHPEYSAQYDNNPSAAVQARRQWLQTAAQSHYRLAGMHLVAPYSIQMGEE